VGAEGGALCFSVGADDAADLEAARPLLRLLGSHITHCGPVGAGSVAKLVRRPPGPHTPRGGTAPRAVQRSAVAAGLGAHARANPTLLMRQQRGWYEGPAHPFPPPTQRAVQRPGHELDHGGGGRGARAVRRARGGGARKGATPSREQAPALQFGARVAPPPPSNWRASVGEPADQPPSRAHYWPCPPPPRSGKRLNLDPAVLTDVLLSGSGQVRGHAPNASGRVCLALPRSAAAARRQTRLRRPIARTPSALSSPRPRLSSLLGRPLYPLQPQSWVVEKNNPAPGVAPESPASNGYRPGQQVDQVGTRRQPGGGVGFSGLRCRARVGSKPESCAPPAPMEAQC
jgi:hypothetical protein